MHTDVSAWDWADNKKNQISLCLSVCPSFVLVWSVAAPLCGRASAVCVINPQPVSWPAAILKPNKDSLRAQQRCMLSRSISGCADVCRSGSQIASVQSKERINKTFNPAVFFGGKHWRVGNLKRRACFVFNSHRWLQSYFGVLLSMHFSHRLHLWQACMYRCR